MSDPPEEQRQPQSPPLPDPGSAAAHASYGSQYSVRSSTHASLAGQVDRRSVLRALVVTAENTERPGNTGFLLARWEGLIG